jgi:hypothetical protein
MENTIKITAAVVMVLATVATLISINGSSYVC